jgi:hypothetical protein
MGTDPSTERKPVSIKALLLRCAGILLILVSPHPIYYATDRYLESSDMDNWPQTEGQVTNHKVYESETRRDVTYAVYIMYTYQVGGKSYRGERAKPDSHAMSAEERDTLLARYPVGSRHQVYYAPSDPTWAYLEPGHDTSLLTLVVMTWLLPVVGLILVALSMAPPAHADSPGAKWARLGGWLVSSCLSCLVIGGVVVRTLFPELLGKGVPTAALFILIPIWSVGLAGLFLWIAGRLRG